jgi:hypothetical protein
MDDELGAATPPGYAAQELSRGGDDRLFIVSADEPGSVGQAIQEVVWRKAMEEELRAIEDNQTWTFTELSVGQRAIGLKWVFKVKRDEQGNVVRHKARLVVKGYAQHQGIYYNEVFAPVARMEIVRLVVAVAAQKGCKSTIWT